MSDQGNPASAPRGLVPTLRLYLAAGAVELRTVAIVANMLTIGRRPYNDVQLDDLTVSGEHALVRVRNGEVAIHDLGSRNGTMVNGLPIKQRTLVDGDIVDIGIYRLRFEAARSSAAEAGGSAPGQQGRSDLAHAGAPAEGGLPDLAAGSAVPDSHGASRGTQSAGDPLAAADAEPVQPGRVEYLSGTQAGQSQLLDRAICRVGGIAGQVAVISRRRGGYFITHLEGLTFPQVNGEPIGLTAHRLADGDLIELAGTMLRFRLGA